MKRNPAAPILRRAALLLREEARALERGFSIGGNGKIWPKAESERARRDEFVSLSQKLIQLSAAFGRSVLKRRGQGKPMLEDRA